VPGRFLSQAEQFRSQCQRKVAEDQPVDFVGLGLGIHHACQQLHGLHDIILACSGVLHHHNLSLVVQLVDYFIVLEEKGGQLFTAY